MAGLRPLTSASVAVSVVELSGELVDAVGGTVFSLDAHGRVVHQPVLSPRAVDGGQVRVTVDVSYRDVVSVSTVTRQHGRT